MMSYTVNVTRQMLRDVEEAVFYMQELDACPKNIEKLVINLDVSIYDKLKKSSLIGTSLSYRLDISTNMRYIKEDDYILFYDVQDNEKKVNVLRFLPAKSNWMNIIRKYL